MITGTQAKVNVGLSSSTDYIKYRQKTKSVFRYEKKVFVTHSLAFSLIKRKGKALRIFYFILKETKKIEMRKPKKRKCSSYLERIKKRTNIFKT